MNEQMKKMVKGLMDEAFFLHFRIQSVILSRWIVSVRYFHFPEPHPFEIRKIQTLRSFQQLDAQSGSDAEFVGSLLGPLCSSPPVE